MVGIKSELYKDTSKTTWDNFVKQSRNGTFIHLRDYMDYHSDRFSDYSLYLTRGSRLLALFPANIEGEVMISHGGLTFGGIVSDMSCKASDTIDILDQIMCNCSKIGIKKIIYKVTPHIFRQYPSEEDLYAIFKMGGKLIRRDLSSVVLLNTRTKYSGSRIKNIKRAKRMGLHAKELFSVGEFFEIVGEALAKHGASPTHTPEEMTRLMNMFPDRIKAFGAYERDHLLAGAIVYDYGRVAHTQYLASSKEGRMCGALDFVIDYMMDRVYCDKTYFSFGISTEQNGRVLNEGLIFQKEGFGGRGIVHDFYELEV